MKNKLRTIVNLEDLLREIFRLHSEGFNRSWIDVQEDYDGSKRISFGFIKENKDYPMQDEFKAIYMRLD